MTIHQKKDWLQTKVLNQQEKINKLESKIANLNNNYKKTITIAVFGILILSSFSLYAINII